MHKHVAISTTIICLFAFLLFALWPFLWLLGAILTICACIGVSGWLWHHHVLFRAKRRHIELMSWVVAHGDTVVFFRPDGSYFHLSAEHVAAGVPQQVIESATPSKEEKEVIERSMILNRREKGLSLREIVRDTGIAYPTVQKVCAAAVDLVIQGNHKERKVSGQEEKK